MLAHRWAAALEAAGLGLVDQVAWCSSRGAGTAWGSWQSPSGPNLRGDWESILGACAGGWERGPPPARRAGHPAPFPVELARRAIRLSTWPGETVLDPFAGSGSTLLAARQLGRHAVGIERSERYCELAVRRLAQMSLDFEGVA